MLQPFSLLMTQLTRLARRDSQTISRLVAAKTRNGTANIKVKNRRLLVQSIFQRQIFKNSTILTRINQFLYKPTTTLTNITSSPQVPFTLVNSYLRDLTLLKQANPLKNLSYSSLLTKRLNQYTPCFINSDYLTKSNLFITSGDLAIYSKYGTQFILSNLGFLYNPQLVQNISKDIQASILRQKYSFLDIAHVKRSLIKARGFFSIHKIKQIAPHLNDLQTLTSSKFDSSTKNLFSINNLLKYQSYSESLSHVAEPWYENYRYTNPLHEFNSQALQIRRIRFKPGYSRI